MLALNRNGWCETKCTFTAFYLTRTYQDIAFRRVSTLKIRAKNFFYIYKSQEGNLVDCWELRLINLSPSKRKSRETLNSGSSRSHLSNSYRPSVQSWHRPNSVSAHEASTSSNALSAPTPPAGKKDRHSAGWLSGPLCPPNIPQSPLPQLPPLTRGLAFHFPFDVSHSAADLFLICVTEST